MAYIKAQIQTPFLLIISLAILATLVFTNQTYEHSLFLKSKSIIKDWQSTNGEYLKDFFIVFTDIGLIIFGILGIISFLIIGSRIKCMFFMMSMILASTLCFLPKLLYHSPRPYWDDDHIKGWDPQIDFGNPSGHTLIMTVLVGSFWLLLALPNEDMGIGNERTNIIYAKLVTSRVGRLVMGIVSFILLFLWLFGVVISRIYLGAHSLDQILYGFLLGVADLFILFLILRDFFIDHFRTIFNLPVLEEKYTDRNTQLRANDRHFARGEVIIPIIIFTYQLLAGIMAYLTESTDLTNQYLNPLPSNYILNINNWSDHTLTIYSLIDQTFYLTGWNSLGLGVYIGILLYRWKFSVESPASQWGIPTTPINYFIRFILFVAIIIPSGSLVIILEVVANEPSVYVNFWFGSVIPGALFGILYFGGIDKLGSLAGCVGKEEKLRVGEELETLLKPTDDIEENVPGNLSSNAPNMGAGEYCYANMEIPQGGQ